MGPATTNKENWNNGSWLINDSPDLVTHLAAEKFIECIQRARRHGYGFVPFVGAGFSAPSGAPLVTEIKSYLQRCICMTLGAEKEMEAWAPRTDQWPPFIDRMRAANANYEPEHWVRLIRDMLNSIKGTQTFALFAQGLGAAAEWRAALHFLSRIDHPPRTAHGPQKKQISLAAPQQEIIDSCLREVLKDKQPTLGHKMLAVLAGALRLDLVLTTNFDSMLEQAFDGARNPLEVFEVHLGSSLPHCSAVSDIRSLIKLHGNRYSLRADYSLDELPSETDKKRFLEYLLSGKGRSDLSRDPYATGLEFQNHLLVMGFSGDDRRTRELIRYAWQHLHSDFKVFWLCYSAGDVRKIQSLTADFVRHSRDTNDSLAGTLEGREVSRHSVILRHTDFGFLLLQLYQTIRRNLPPLGSVFPSVSRLTFPPMVSTAAVKHKESRSELSFSDEIRRHLKDFQPVNVDDRLRILVATSEDNVAGVTSACSDIYREMEADNICIWMDMNDISSTDNLFEVLLEAAYFRLGSENWTPVYIASDDRPRVDEIRRLAHSVSKPWIIFVNARETPGVNTTDERDIHPNSNGWLDIPEPSSRDGADSSACTSKFVRLLYELCGEQQSKAISVVLLCRDSSDDASPLIKELRKHSVTIVKLRSNSKERIEFSEDEIAARSIAWTAGNKHKRRFLHALVLMQRPRLLATIWSSATSLNGDQSNDTLDQREQWVTELEECGLLRRKAGGFIWIHSRCRQFIRAKLDLPAGRLQFFQKFPEAKNAWGDWQPKIDEPEIHEKLAEWYGKVLDASEFPSAVFEAVYHLCRAAETSLELFEGQTATACDRLEAATSLLRANGFLIQTHGYSRGSCRHLEYIRDTLCPAIRGKSTPLPAVIFNATQRLQIVCTEVMRMVAREVGEDAKLYLRHRQFGIFLAGKKWTLEYERKSQSERTYHISAEIYRHLSSCEALNSGDTDHQKFGGMHLNAAQSEWLRWWRWCGMLGIASRSFPVAKRALEKGLRFARQTTDAYPAETGTIDWQRLTRGEFMIFGKRPQASQLQGLRIEVLRIMEQYVDLLVLEDNLTERLQGLAEVDQNGGIKIQPAQEALDRLELIKSHVVCAQKLASEIRGRDHSSDSHYTVQAIWCELRLLMHLSVCAARRVQLGFDNEHAVPMALLGDAEAGLRFSDPRRSRSELAMIELHRADARLRQAGSVQLYDGVAHKPMSFAKMCRILEFKEYTDRQRGQNEQLRLEFLGEGGKWEPSVNKALRRAKSLVADSMRFLNRAEPVLRSRRRNVWWTTWFFERRLRAIAMAVWASVFEVDTPIPFLGLEAAMRKTDTLADTILKDAIRMIRVDAYRLATIVDAYASCAKALQARLILDKNSIILINRQEDMRAELHRAIEALEKVEERRRSLISQKWEADGRMAANVQLYVEEIQRQAEYIVRNYHPIEH